MTPGGGIAARGGMHRSEHGLLLAAGDALAATVALVVALRVWSITTGFPFNLAFVTERMAWLLAVPVWIAVVSPTRTWHAAHALDRTVSGLLSAAAALLAIYAVLYFYAPPAALARLPALYFIWEAVLLTAGWRLVYLFVLGRGTLSRRAVIVGSGARALAARALIDQVARDTVVVAVVADHDAVVADHDAVGAGKNHRSGGAGAAGAMEVRPLDDLDALASEGIVEVVLALDQAPSPALSARLLRLQEQGLDVVPFAAEYEQRLQRVPIEHLDPHWAFTSLPEWVRERDASQIAKRVVDLVGAIVGGAVLVVLVVPIALAVSLDSGRPLLYRQKRVGRNGRRFDVIKFRTMTVGAEAGGARWASADDPRVTRVGRWLRRARLDEWPQVLNVLRGDMSLVGPRPERPEFADELTESIPFYRTRLMVQPGLTGWAQVNADYGDSVEGQARKLEYDLYYIKHRSLLFDLWILVRTIGTVLGLKGR